MRNKQVTKNNHSKIDFCKMYLVLKIEASHFLLNFETNTANNWNSIVHLGMC